MLSVEGSIFGVVYCYAAIIFVVFFLFLGPKIQKKIVLSGKKASDFRI